MSSRPSAAREASQRGDPTALPSQNPAAYVTPADQPSDAPTSPSPRDTKRSNAAQLARELGSSTPWSETLVPQSYASISPRSASADRQESTQIEQDIDPPPVYTRNPQYDHLRPVYELPAEAMNNPVTEDTVEPHSSPSTDDEQNQSLQRANPDIETPLLPLPRSRSIQDHEPYPKIPTWLRPCGIAFAIIIAILILCCLGYLLFILFIIQGLKDHFGFFPRCPESTLPIIHTGPDYERHEATNDINGVYKLYDAIWLTTTTGAIDIEIDPQPADHPAFLTLTTGTGGITLRLSPQYHCQRPKVQRTIHTHIQSLTGNVVAEILLGYGGSARIEAAAGLQNLSVLTYGVGPEDEPSNLTTQSNTGIQKVVLTTLEQSYTYMSNVRGLHHSFGTSSLDIVYPSAWVGVVHAAASFPGQVKVSGENLKYTKQKGTEITAYRGEGANLTLIEVISEGTGSASFKCQ